MTDIANGPRLVEDDIPSDETLEFLLRRAGRRPPVPSDDARKVKNAAYAQWQQTVKAEKRRALSLRAGALLAAAAAVVLVLHPGLRRGSQTLSPVPLATLEAATGSVWSAGVELRAGDPLSADSILETRADEASPARAVLRLASGATVRVDVDSRLRLVSSSIVALERGGIYIDTGPEAMGATLEVRTSLGIARDIGTRFEVRRSDGDEPLRIRVRTGKVRLEREDGSHLVAAGVELTVASDGSVEQRAVPLHGAPWQWTQAILPLYDIEGRSLREFLEWAAAEGGWQLRFADEAVAELAASTILHGSIDGLDLQDAKAMSLLGSGLDLSYRVEEGDLVVGREH